MILLPAVALSIHSDDGHVTRSLRSESVIPCTRITMILVFWLAGTLCSSAQEPGSDSTHQVDEQVQQIDQLERKIRKLESDIGSLKIENQQLEQTQRQILDDSGGIGVVLFLFAVFCALWAQNTKRNAWLWFFLGLFFHVIAVLVLLHKNSKDLRNPTKREYAKKEKDTNW